MSTKEAFDFWWADWPKEVSVPREDGNKLLALHVAFDYVKALEAKCAELENRIAQYVDNNATLIIQRDELEAFKAKVLDSCSTYVQWGCFDGDKAKIVDAEKEDEWERIERVFIVPCSEVLGEGKPKRKTIKDLSHQLVINDGMDD